MISQWLATAKREAPSCDTPSVAQHALPHGCKAIIAPYVTISNERHAGYRFAGPTFAWAYQCIDPRNMYAVATNQKSPSIGSWTLSSCLPGGLCLDIV